MPLICQLKGSVHKPDKLTYLQFFFPQLKCDLRYVYFGIGPMPKFLC